MKDEKEECQSHLQVRCRMSFTDTPLERLRSNGDCLVRIIVNGTLGNSLETITEKPYVIPEKKKSSYVNDRVIIG